MQGITIKYLQEYLKSKDHNVRSHLKSLQLKPDKISSFFRAEFTAYAAA
jgi:hypothetical protein